MTTKPSSAPWADEPFALIPTPPAELLDTHGCYRAATGMTRAHNIILRGLNAIIQQGPHVPTSEDANFRSRDVQDFLRYVRCWRKMTSHHHHVEEDFFIPELEKASNQPGRLESARDEHRDFEEGMKLLEAYAEATKPKEFRWNGAGGMKKIVDELSIPLTKHLYDEIGLILALKDLDSEMVRDLWARVGSYAQNMGSKEMWSDIYPCVLGTADSTFENIKAPNKLPWFLPYLVKYWYAFGDGAWRFNPCDFWGQPRQLQFLARIKA